jgi:hypothetical protein
MARGIALCGRATMGGGAAADVDADALADVGLDSASGATT